MAVKLYFNRAFRKAARAARPAAKAAPSAKAVQVAVVAARAARAALVAVQAVCRAVYRGVGPDVGQAAAVKAAAAAVGVKALCHRDASRASRKAVAKAVARAVHAQGASQCPHAGVSPFSLVSKALLVARKPFSLLLQHMDQLLNKVGLTLIKLYATGPAAQYLGTVKSFNALKGPKFRFVS